MQQSLEPIPDADYFFTIIRSPDAEYDSWAPKLPEDPFVSGFSGTDDDAIKALLGGTVRGGIIDIQAMAVLDNRSVRDDTFVLSLLVPSELKALRNGADTGNAPKMWWQCRLPFKQAWNFYGVLYHTGDYGNFCDETFVGEDGVFDVPAMYKANGYGDV